MGSERSNNENRAEFREELNRFAATLLRAGKIDAAAELEAARPRLARLGFAEPGMHETVLPGGDERRVLLVFDRARAGAPR